MSCGVDSTRVVDWTIVVDWTGVVDWTALWSGLDWSCGVD